MTSGAPQSIASTCVLGKQSVRLGDGEDVAERVEVGELLRVGQEAENRDVPANGVEQRLALAEEVLVEDVRLPGVDEVRLRDLREHARDRLQQVVESLLLDPPSGKSHERAPVSPSSRFHAAAAAGSGAGRSEGG